MPTIPNIRTSVENQQTLILDSHARLGQFLRDRRDRLIAYTGGFTVVYPYTINNEKWALRCWHADLGNVRKRFNVISKAIQRSKASYLCDFVYVDEGIVVDGKVYPITRMRWVDGMTIKDYICKHKNSKNKLLQLAESFLFLVQDMHRNQFAHGDLQHGNIIVNDKGELFLVDYDSFYCPDLNGEREIITGLKDYQHPLRQSNLIVSEKIDYFSELIIYLSILAIAHNSTFVDKYQVADSEHLLFEAKDFQNLKGSSIYNDILMLGDIFPILLQILDIYLSKMSLSELQPFDVLLDQLTKEPEINDFDTSCGTSCFFGEEITFFWDIKHFTKVFFNGVPIATNTKTLKITSSQHYTLEVVNGQKVTKKTLKVNVFEKPIIKFSSSSNKLRKGKNEEIELKWEVKHAHQIKLLCKNKIVKDNVNFQDLYKCNLDEDAVIFTLRVKALDKKTIFEEKIKIDILPEATIKFEVDKEYVFPNIPFTLKWETENAKKVTLNGKDVDLIGGEVFEDGTQKETKYTLSVIDEFGTKEKEIVVKMLPLPRIESLVVPMPNIEKNINMTVNLNIPNIAIDLLSCDLQKIGLNVEAKVVEGINAPPKVELKSDLEELNYWNKIKKNIKNLFNRQ